MVSVEVVKLNPALEALKQRLVKIMAPLCKDLCDARVLFNGKPDSLSRGMVYQCLAEFNKNPPADLPRERVSDLRGELYLLQSLTHAVTVLKVHGAESAHKKLLSIQVTTPPTVAPVQVVWVPA